MSATTIPGIIPSTHAYRFEQPTAATVRDPDHWDLLSWRLPAMQEHAAERGIQFTDDPALSVNAVRFEDGQWVLTPGLTSYYRWAVSSGALDVPLNDHESLTLPGVGSTLRQRLGIRVDGPQGLDGLPVPVKAGCGAAVVTTDGQLILGVRNKAFVAGITAGAVKG